MLNMPEKIESERIVLLRPYPSTPDVAMEVFKKINLSRETLRKWLGWVDATQKPEDVWLVNGSHENWEKGCGYAYLIRHKETNEVLGSIDLMKYNEKNKSAEIGAWLSDDAVGYGYITEALRCLEKIVFDQGLNRIVILNETKNIRSVNIPKRGGYILEGTMRSYKWNEKRQSFCDVYIWSKLKSDWEKQ